MASPTVFPTRVAWVPTLDLDQTARLSAGKTATLIGDLNDLLLTLDTHLTNLLCFTLLDQTRYASVEDPISHCA